MNRMSGVKIPVATKRRVFFFVLLVKFDQLQLQQRFCLPATLNNLTRRLMYSILIVKIVCIQSISKILQQLIPRVERFSMHASKQLFTANAQQLYGVCTFALTHHFAKLNYCFLIFPTQHHFTSFIQLYLTQLHLYRNPYSKRQNC